MRKATFLLLAAAAVHAQSGSGGVESFTLPNDVIPKRHIIELTVDPDRDTFTGWAQIEVELLEPTSTLWLNAKNITASESSVNWQGRAIQAKARAEGGEFLALDLPSKIGPGRATISIHYQANLPETAVAGPYRNKVAGDWYAFTTFTPIDARRAFPCFDEPRFKTPWQISIHIKRTDKAFSNAKQISETDEPNQMKLVKFATTEPLAAEVVAFCVGPFDVYEGPIRVISAKGQRDQSSLAAQAAADVLPRLEAYTGIPYPYGKLDLVAVPEFKFGAVENPGLITFKATSLLRLPSDDPAVKSRRIRAIESHEIAHQWFGDMVTQATWTDVWLSEGFATWLSAKVMDEEQPQARKLLSSVAARERIMATDAGPKTRPVRLVMHSREDTDRVYSQFVYQKGAAILVMLDGWLGETRVRDGLRQYLKAHRFANASTADLESSLPGTKPVLDSFLDQTGIPSIRVRCSDGNLQIDETNPEHQWTVPVCWHSATQSACTVIQTHAEVAMKSCPAWIYPNAGGAGYYRTEWTEDQLTALDVSKLTAAERLTLVYDLKAAKLPMPESLAKDPEPEIAKAAKQ